MQQSTATALAPVEEDASQRLEEFAARLQPANINPQTFLATDYLNHFNEAIMLLELTPDMPDMLEEAKAWQPKDYKDHFQDSDFAEKDLACEAYDRAPERFRIPFDLTKRALDRRIARAIETAGETIAQGDPDRLKVIMPDSCEAIRELICVAGGIINGCDTHPVQAVDKDRAAEETEVVMAQQDIDALFGDDEDDGAAADAVADEAPVGGVQAVADPVVDSAAQAAAAAVDAPPAADAADGESLMSQDDIDSLFD